MNSDNPRGQVGTIMVILVFGLLVSISTAYIKMVQTETQVQGMIDKSERALDAAFSGVNFVMSVAQGQKPMFDPPRAAQRIYFTRTTPLANDWADIGTATFAPTNYPNATSSDWFYLKEDLGLFDFGETGSSTKPYHFRVISYPVLSAGVINTNKYAIKSQGRFITYNNDQVTVSATHTSQIIAECEINFTRKVIQLKRWRYMPFQAADNLFFKATPY